MKIFSNIELNWFSKGKKLISESHKVIAVPQFSMYTIGMLISMRANAQMKPKWYTQKIKHTKNFALVQFPIFWSSEPTTLRHLLADVILAKDKPVNFAISSSSRCFPWLLFSAFWALCIWLIALCKEYCTKKFGSCIFKAHSALVLYIEGQKYFKITKG